MTTSIATTLDAKTLRTLRRRIEKLEYSREQADYGIAWVRKKGFRSIDDAFVIAMSRILYGDDQLDEGVRFDGGAA